MGVPFHHALCNQLLAKPAKLNFFKTPVSGQSLSAAYSQFSLRRMLSIEYVSADVKRWERRDLNARWLALMFGVLAIAQLSWKRFVLWWNLLWACRISSCCSRNCSGASYNQIPQNSNHALASQVNTLMYPCCFKGRNCTVLYKRMKNLCCLCV